MMRAWTIAGFFDRRSVTAASVAAAALAIAFAPLAGRAQREASGSWRIQYVEDDNQVQLSFENFDARGHSSTGSQVPLSALEGLSASQLRGSPSDAHFRLRRDAGTFTLDGRVGNNRGSGQFEFTADPRFAAGLASRGYSKPDPEEQFHMALHDVGYSLLDELKTQGYRRPSIDGLITMGQHGVHHD
ncbi:MAG TPA: hypothetical protein VFC35_04170, partial [Gemmatimonadaceae bacterium]|nr:hypothetical protein [Gemmatimonadaceae bacterium]